MAVFFGALLLLPVMISLATGLYFLVQGQLLETVICLLGAWCGTLLINDLTRHLPSQVEHPEQAPTE